MSQNRSNQYILNLSKVLLIISALWLSNCAHKEHHHDHKVDLGHGHAEAVLEPRSGNKTLKGTVDFMVENDLIIMTAKVEGLKPNTIHGFHIHQIGDCSKDDASSAGPHFSPNAGNKHGSHTDPNRHAGDLGNLKSNKDGVAELRLELPGLNLKSKDDTYSILNRAVVVHADADDFVSQPAGNSGARIGCGIIQKVNH